MLFTARSSSFPQVIREEPLEPHASPQPVQPAHLPWFVLTFLDLGALTATWETVCACTEKELLAHLKDRPRAEFAQLLCMAPPVWSARRRWSRHHISTIDKGRVDGRFVTVYTSDRGEQYCFDAKDVNPADVTHRFRLFHVQPRVHFD